jgi:addiction module HigA family antidote
MLTRKRKPASVGDILVEEFMEPMGLTQGTPAEAMGVRRKHVNELCNDRRNVTAPLSPERERKISERTKAALQAAKALLRR